LKKSDLKTGMRVQLRDGDTYLTLRDADTPLGHEDMLLVNPSGWFNGSDYNDDLTGKYNKVFDVVKVFEAPNAITNIINLSAPSKLLWQRTETKEMTVAEIEKELGYKIKIIK
jgi:predicted CoA-binding protein